MLKAEARRLGFQLVGVTLPDQPPHYDIYLRWLAAGRQGEMAYLSTESARQRRGDPRQILPECRAILVLGMRYAPPQRDLPPNDMPAGEIAAYAWGDDYHELFPPRLKSLVEFLENQVGAPIPNRWYTDTGPILERDLAQQAGLGWIGKNTCLINPEQGSYFLLAEILLGVELQPDEPFLADRCGSCTRCLEACPTQCILPDRTLDARRCISYLTIELKGPIPVELRPQVGSHVYGCDICQQVCPWNQRFAGPTEEAAFAPRPGLPLPDLAAELALTPHEFNAKFKASPVKRSKRRGYLRNVAVALGNHPLAAGNPAALAALCRSLLQDSEPLVRAHAAWALGRLGGAQAAQALHTAASQETDATVRDEIQAALLSIQE